MHRLSEQARDGEIVVKGTDGDEQYYQRIHESSRNHNTDENTGVVRTRGVDRGGHGCMSSRHRRLIFVTAPLVFSRVSIFCPWTLLGTSVPQTLWFVPP